MKTKEEILEDYGVTTNVDGNEYMKYGCTMNKIREAMEAYASERTGEYKEFMEWLVYKSHGNFNSRIKLHKYWNGTVNEWRSTVRMLIGMNWTDISIDELFDYWKKEVKK